MAQYTYAQLQQLWRSVGGSAIAAPFAAAVALAESGGNSSDAHTNTDGSTDRGLWQINSIHGGLSTLDPTANARAAVQISNNGTNWRPWCVVWSDGKCGGTFLGSGAPVFKYFQGDVNSVGMSTPSGQSGTGTVDATNAGLANPFNPTTWAQAFLHPLFVSFWYFILGLLGAVLMFTGLFLLVKESRAAGVVKLIMGKTLRATPQTAVAGAAIEAKESQKKVDKEADKSETKTEVKSESPAEREIREGKERDPNDLGY